MLPYTNRIQQKFKSLLYAALSLFLVISVIIFPEQALQSSMTGLRIWWELIFPILLPFIILTEFCAAFGIIHFLGVLLQPVMRNLFRLPGEAGWVFVAGFTAGHPVGAQATAELRKNQEVSLLEGERLLALSHFCSPILMINVIAISFFHSAPLGYILTGVHLISMLICGMLLDQKNDFSTHRSISPPSTGLWTQCFNALEMAQQKDGRKIGQILGESVMYAIHQLMKIGGIMMMFSVIIRILELSVLPYLYKFIDTWLGPLFVDLSKSLFIGIFEIHLGAYALSQLEWASPITIFVFLSALLAWGGLSTHAQLQAMTHDTDLRYRRFLKIRSLHVFVSVIVALICWIPFKHHLNISMSRTVLQLEYTPHTETSFIVMEWLTRWSQLTLSFTIGIGSLLCISLCIRCVEWIRNKSLKAH